VREGPREGPAVPELAQVIALTPGYGSP